MGVIDIVILCCFLPAVYTGLKKGLIKQLVAVAVIYFGITLSLRFTDAVSTLISSKTSLTGFWLNFISFIIIFALVALVLNLLGGIISKIIKVTLLGWLDRLLGIILSLMVAAAIISLIIYLLNSINDLIAFIPSDQIEESKFFNPLLKLSRNIFPYLGKLF